MKLPRIAVTMGDPAGIGPEICLRLLSDEGTAASCSPIVFGDASVMRRVAEKLSLPFRAPVMGLAEWRASGPGSGGPVILDLQCIGAGDFEPGRVSALCGDAAFRYVAASIDAALAGEVVAVATAPINKEALHAGGHKYPGHTEIFAERMHAERSCMMLTSDALTCSFVTVHVGYRDVPALLSEARVLDVLELTAEAVRRLRDRAPRLAVCGLNPHAGEHGLFGGGEEEKFIVPAIEAMRRRNFAIEGPLPPDTAFLASRRARTDAYVCMYHDQGLIPLKALAFEEAVNVTLGLPIVRTSVDHGTAFDIAWRGEADVSSFIKAVELAAKLTRKG